MIGVNERNKIERIAKITVGVLTYHYTTNYGAVLQVYALTRLLDDLGYACEVIDYRPWRAMKVYAKALFMNRDIFDGIKKYLRFRSFIQQSLPLSGHKTYRTRDIKYLFEPYSSLVVGSDEVWKTDSFRGYDPAFFLESASVDQKRLSFSASIGGTPSFGPKKDQVCSCLSRFHAISVRDSKTAALLSKECGVSSVKHLDPTLLIDFQWPKTLDIKNKGIVLVYGALRDEEMEHVCQYASQQGYRVISIGVKNRGADKNIVGAGIVEWIEYMKSAKRVYTTFFHGAIFSLKFHHETYVFHRSDKSYKVVQLAEDLHLESSSVEVVSESGGGLVRYFYSSLTEKVINDARKSAACYLRLALGASSKP